ncbi:MAG TPA: response regulator transcription factor, partial [Myxococcota bacterium]|nr:response regulator transcription factor [Myxococcota bacterium]
MAERILLVEDDLQLGGQIVEHLKAAGFEPLWWREGHAIPADAPPEVALVILDLMLPRLSGFELLAQLRAASDVPVLVLSARSETTDKVRALKLGADDYMTKPFWPEELTERVRARIRRPVLQRSTVLELGRLRLDAESRQVWVEEDEVELTPAEFNFLFLLARRPGVAVTRSRLATEILDPDRSGTVRT